MLGFETFPIGVFFFLMLKIYFNKHRFIQLCNYMYINLVNNLVKSEA